MRIFGLDVPDSSIKYGTYSKQSGFEMMEELLRGSFLPDAVICEDKMCIRDSLHMGYLLFSTFLSANCFHVQDV